MTHPIQPTLTQLTHSPSTHPIHFPLVPHLTHPTCSPLAPHHSPSLPCHLPYYPPPLTHLHFLTHQVHFLLSLNPLSFASNSPLLVPLSPTQLAPPLTHPHLLSHPTRLTSHSPTHSHSNSHILYLSPLIHQLSYSSLSLTPSPSPSPHSLPLSSLPRFPSFHSPNSLSSHPPHVLNLPTLFLLSLTQFSSTSHSPDLILLSLTSLAPHYSPHFLPTRSNSHSPTCLSIPSHSPNSPPPPTTPFAPLFLTPFLIHPTLFTFHSSHFLLLISPPPCSPSHTPHSLAPPAYPTFEIVVLSFKHVICFKEKKP